MIRWLGAALILGGGTAIGLSAAMRLRVRAALLGRLAAAIGRMETELSFRLTPLPGLLHHGAEQAGDKAVSDALLRCRAALLAGTDEPFHSLWRGEVARCETLPLREEERCLLEELGGVLGNCGWENQASFLQSVRSRLNDCRARAEAERDGQARVFVTLGVSAGAVLALALL